MSQLPFTTTTLPDQPDTLAPDGSEIRFLPAPAAGTASFVHCTLPAGATSRAVRHQTVEEVWFVLSGRGELWRGGHGQDLVTALGAGTSITLPVGTHFQFRCTGIEPLCIVIATLPPWPGAQEALRVADFWPVAD